MRVKDLPLRFPTDPYCRALTRLMLCVDDESGHLFIGVTPDGTQAGRDMLARLSPCRGEEVLPYTVAQENGAIVLSCGEGKARLALAKPDRVVIEAEGISLLLGKGKSAAVFMGGGNAVDDALPGALYVNAGVRVRVLARVGSTSVRSSWDLNALADPDPRVFMHPDESGRLKAEMFATDFDELPPEDEASVDAAVKETLDEFGRFLDGLCAQPKDADALRAAYITWTALQPPRRLAAPQISAPVYVQNRRKLGTAKLSDNVLLAALLADPGEAAGRLRAFLALENGEGAVPSEADNRRRLYESELPLFGVVFSARPDVLGALTEADFEALYRALGWWREFRYCSERGLFFYLHRYEPGCGPKAPFSENAPEFAFELNACMLLWLSAMADLADRLGRPEAAGLGEAAKKLRTALPALGERGFDAAGNELADERGGSCFGLLLGKKEAPERIPAAYALPLLIGAPNGADLAAKARVRGGRILSLRRALTLLAADFAERRG